MKKVGILILSVIVIFATTSAASAAPANLVNSAAMRAHTEFAASVYGNDDSFKLFKVRAVGHGISQQVALPAKWILGEARISPNGLLTAISGHETLNLGNGGIRIKCPRDRQWRTVTHHYGDTSPSWISNIEIAFIRESQAMKVNVATGEETPIYPGVWQMQVAANPATGKTAIIEEFYPDDPEIIMLSWISVVDADGNLISATEPIANRTIWDLDWSPCGNQLMFTLEWVDGSGGWHDGLYISDGTNYGVRVEDDIYLGTFLPGGGYAFTNISEGPGPSYTRTSVITARPAFGRDYQLAINGSVYSLDAYLR